MMTTVARPQRSEASHYYLPTGEPFYEVPYADPTKGMRKATLADARKVGALPSVTTIMKVLDKPALTAWLIEQAVLAVITTPRLPGEADDAFIERVLHTEKQQEQEGQKARDLGTEIHDAIAQALKGEPYPDHLSPYVTPALDACKQFGEPSLIEHVIVGEGYAGRLDAAFTNGKVVLLDFKTTKKLPKTAYPEHRLQLSAYAKATKADATANLYISTAEPGRVALCVNPPWQDEYPAFQNVLSVWQWLNNYRPT